jgi:hypothetical protein
MALSILDGNQSATTLSSVVTGGEHIVAHSVVSLGSNAISNITAAVSGSVVTIPNLNVLARSVATEGIADGTLNFVKIGGHQDGSNQTAHIVHVSGGGAMKVDASDSTVTFGVIRGTVTIGNSVTIGSLPAISGTVTANAFGLNQNGSTSVAIPVMNYDGSIGGSDLGFVVPVQISNTSGTIDAINPLPISGTVTIGSALPAGTNRIGVVTIGAGTVTIGAGTAQIGSVTASLQASSITGSLKSLTYQDISTVAYLNVAVGSLPALTSGTNQIGSVTVSNSVTIGSLPAISGTVTANLAISSSAITSGSFTSLASATLVPANTARKMATVYNLGAGQLFVNAGVTATTLGGGFMVALNSGDYYECDFTTTTLSAIFATAGTASWVSH